MKFTCLPRKNLTVILVPGKTKFFGPGQFENQEGLNAIFNNGYLIVDELTDNGFDLVKRLVAHKQFGSEFMYVQESTPGFTAEGRPAMVIGFTLAEAMAFAEKFHKKKAEDRKAKNATMTEEQALEEVLGPAPTVAEETLQPADTLGPKITTGPVHSAVMQKKNEKPGPPRSKFVKPAEPAPAQPVVTE